MTLNSVRRASLAFRGAALSLCVGLVCQPAQVQAAALDAESCARLKAQQEEMEKAGLKDLLAKGPEWAKTNLPPEKLNEIKRWIEVDEQLLFRCPGRHLVNLPLEPDPPPPPAVDEKKPEAADKADAPAASPRPAPPPVPPAPAAADKKMTAPAPKKAPEKAPEKKAEPQRKAPPVKDKSNTDGPEDGDAKPAPKVKATAKQKPNDAFKPPPSDPNNPFGLN